MARVILHIGAHKTATSYLQASFFRNRATLAKHGLHYPAIGPNDAHHALVGAWIDMPDIPAAFYGAGGPEALWDKVIADHLDLPGTLFLSAEPFSRVWPQAIPMAEVAKRLSGFESIQVVYTMRQQTELIPSVWAQIARSRRVTDPKSFVRTALEQRRAEGVPVDHNMVYDRLLTGFAPEQIRILDYGQFARAPGGVVQTFLDLAGLRLTAAELAPVPPDEANISPNPLALFLALRIRPGGPPPPDLVETIAQALKQAGRRPTTLLSRTEYARVAGRFAASNARLVERVQPVQPGFTFAETAAPADMLYRYDVDAVIWAAIAGAIYDRLPPPGITAQVGPFLRRVRRKLSVTP